MTRFLDRCTITISAITTSLMAMSHVAAAEGCRLLAGMPEAYAAMVDANAHAAPPHHPQSDRVFVDPTVAFHGQLLVGDFAHHLSVFMGDPDNHPHNFQVVLELDLPEDMATALAQSREAHPESMHTAVPVRFAQTALMIDVPGHPRKASFENVVIFRNHFERPDRVPIASGGPVGITRIVQLRELAPKLPKPEVLAYLVIPTEEGAQLTNYLSGPPDFQQIALARVSDAAALEAMGEASIELSGRPNTVADRLRPGETLSCTSDDGTEVTIEVAEEAYCEMGEFTHIVSRETNPNFGTPQDCPVG